MNHHSSFPSLGHLLAIAALALPSTRAFAQDGPPPGWVGPPPGWSGGVLLGAARAPLFEGSRDSRSQPVLGAEITYRSASLGSVAMGSRGLQWTVVQQPDFSAGVGLATDPGRVDNGDRKLTAMGYRPGSESLRGLGEIRATPVVQAFGSYTLAGVSLTSAVRRATGSHEGSQIELGLSLPWKIGRHATLSITPSATWADRRYSQAFFGVTPSQSAASGYTVFEAGAGLKSSQLVLDFDMALSRYWYVNAVLQAKRLQGDAADSPIVQKTRQTSGMLVARYQFQL